MTEKEPKDFIDRRWRDGDTIPDLGLGPLEQLFDAQIDARHAARKARRQEELDLLNGVDIDPHDTVRCPPKPAAAPARQYSDHKSIPLQTGCYDYFPAALREVARLSKLGNDKHNPGEPLHWSQDKSSDHADCIARHQQAVGQPDEDWLADGVEIDHAVCVAWRALAQLQMLCQERGAPVPKGAKVKK